MVGPRKSFPKVSRLWRWKTPRNTFEYLSLGDPRETRRRTKFLVMDNLTVPVILGTDFIDLHVAAIHVRRNRLEILSGKDIPIGKNEFPPGSQKADP